ncbi:MAG: hypothetical protein [Olavius algarvensis Delta 4 endosymbiont]|nr:MAG: hypothetical protein [Olavius algarvensis Delta 4 endosymbiont]
MPGGPKSLSCKVEIVKHAGFVDKSAIIGYKYDRWFKSGDVYPARGIP